MAVRYPSAVIFTLDVGRLASFYSKVFGMRRRRKAGDYTVLSLGSFELTLYRIPDSAACDCRIEVPPVVRELSSIKLSFPASSIARARAKAAMLGGAVYPADKEWGTKSAVKCDGYDPDGNVLQVVQLVHPVRRRARPGARARSATARRRKSIR